MKMRVPRTDIATVVKSAAAERAISPVAAARARGISVSLKNEDDDLTVPTEINVIGQTVDDATREVERFVDRAFLAGMPRVRVVHGSGMGILRKALRQFLKAHPHLATVIEPPQNEGGGGAAVVELRVYRENFVFGESFCAVDCVTTVQRILTIRRRTPTHIYTHLDEIRHHRYCRPHRSWQNHAGEGAHRHRCRSSRRRKTSRDHHRPRLRKS